MVDRKNETEIYLYEYIKKNKNFSNEWEPKKLNKNKNKYIQSILDKSSKRSTGNRGEPDLIYCNDGKKILILLENKDSIKEHTSVDGKSDPIKYAVDGVQHYLSFFLEENLPASEQHIKDWKIVGIAFSGDINDEYNKRMDTFFIKDNKIENADISEFLDEEDYISLTDIAKYKSPNTPADVIKNWTRKKDTIEFLGLWEKINNENFVNNPINNSNNKE